MTHGPSRAASGRRDCRVGGGAPLRRLTLSAKPPRPVGPSLGIAIPSYEQAAFVQRTLRSLQGVSIPFEAIIRDGGSCDGTIDAIRSSVGDDDRFALVVEEDDGQADAINRALDELIDRHPYVTWVNTDDVYVPDAFTRLVEHLDETSSAAAMFGDFDIIDEEGRALGRVRRPNVIRRSQLLHYYNMMPGFGMAVRSRVLREVGLLDETLDYAMDLDLWLRVSRHGKLARHPETVVEFRWHPGSKTAGMAERSALEVSAVADRYRRGGAMWHLLVRTAWRLQGRLMRALGIWQEVDPELLRREVTRGPDR